MFKCFGKGWSKNRVRSPICVSCRDHKDIIVDLHSSDMSMVCPHCKMKYYSASKKHK